MIFQIIDWFIEAPFRDFMDLFIHKITVSSQLGDQRKSMEESVTQNYLTPLEDCQVLDNDHNHFRDDC